MGGNLSIMGCARAAREQADGDAQDVAITELRGNLDAITGRLLEFQDKGFRVEPLMRDHLAAVEEILYAPGFRPDGPSREEVIVRCRAVFRLAIGPLELPKMPGKETRDTGIAVATHALAMLRGVGALTHRDEADLLAVTAAAHEADEIEEAAEELKRERVVLRFIPEMSPLRLERMPDADV